MGGGEVVVDESGRPRVAGRVVLVHAPTGRVLLQLHGWPHEPHWGCPGGGVEDGGSPRDAARRELTEETGRRDEPGEELFTWEHDFRFAGKPVRQHETYLLARTDDDHVPAQAPDPEDGIVRRAWVSPEDLQALAEPVWPPDLAVRLADVTRKPWLLRPTTPADAQWLADLKAVAMRADLERLGYWDRDVARQRFLQAFVPANTHVVVVDGVAVGCIAVRPEADAQWVEHFYLAPSVQGRGLGRAVLTHVMDHHRDHRPFWLAMDRGSRVRRLYESVGFVHHHDDANGVDQLFRASPRTAGHEETSRG